jgi:hypothetical protein
MYLISVLSMPSVVNRFFSLLLSVCYAFSVVNPLPLQCRPNLPGGEFFLADAVLFALGFLTASNC